MTLTEQQTVAEVAAASLGAVRVFESKGIDYCCGGKRSLEEVCREKGIESERLLEELAGAIAGPDSPEKDWNTAPLGELIQHIMARHHEYLKLELPRLNERLRKVISVYSEQDGALLAEMSEVFGALWQELDGHMRKEELILFPTIERYEAAIAGGGPVPPVPFGSIANPIRMMEMEHGSAGDALRRLNELTNGYTPPAHACTTYKALFSGLEELERDLHLHIHLENNILFPRAIALETANRPRY
jgi:regulator of cell morphogenesis and NO signaling